MKTNSLTWSPLFLAALLFLASGLNPVSAAELYFIDAHSQLDHTIDDPELVIQRMNESDVYRTILAARSNRQPDDIADFADRHPQRIVPAVRTKSGAYINNSPKYYKKMEKQLRDGRFKAMAEILLYHAQKGDLAPEVTVYPDDPRVRFALKAAMKNHWPFVIHIEFASLQGDQRQQFMHKMKKLLADNPQQAIVLNHLGQLSASELAPLLEEYKNLHVLTAHANPVIIKNSNQPWSNMFEGKTLSPEWRALVIQHPEQFVFALDNVWERHWREFYPEQMDYWKSAMADLPDEVAHAVAHGNAERLWRLAPKPFALNPSIKDEAKAE
jgi:predicted TIM-barrel fold metal-dependent hydrolase